MCVSVCVIDVVMCSICVVVVLWLCVCVCVCVCVCAVVVSVGSLLTLQRGEEGQGK